MLLNRDHEISQNGGPVANAPDGTEVTDRWINNKIGSMGYTISRDTDVPSVALAGRVIKHSHRLTLTTPQNSLGASDEMVTVQKIAGSRFRNIAQRACKVPMFVKATQPGTFGVSFRNDVPDLSCVVPVTINVGNTWEAKLLDLPATPSTGTWCYDESGAGLRVGVVLAAGSTFQAPSANSWLSGYFHTVAGMTNYMATGNTDFWFTGMDIYPADEGPAPTPIYEEDLWQCQRIRRRFTNLAAGSKILLGVACSTTMASFVYQGDFRKITAINYAGGLTLWDALGTASAITSIALVGSDAGTVAFQVNCAGGLVAGRQMLVRMNAPSDYLELNGSF